MYRDSLYNKHFLQSMMCICVYVHFIVGITNACKQSKNEDHLWQLHKISLTRTLLQCNARVVVFCVLGADVRQTSVTWVLTGISLKLANNLLYLLVHRWDAFILSFWLHRNYSFLIIDNLGFYDRMTILGVFMSTSEDPI